MSNVVHFPGVTTLPIPCDRVLNAAIDANLESVIVIGWTREGMLYAAGSNASIPDTLYLIEQLKHELLSGD